MCMPKSGKATNFLFCNYSAWIFLHIIWLCFQLIICPIKNKIDMMCYLFALQIKLCLTLSICIRQILQYWRPLMPPVLCKGFWLFHYKFRVLLTFTKEILNGKLHYLCIVSANISQSNQKEIPLRIFPWSLQSGYCLKRHWRTASYISKYYNF